MTEPVLIRVWKEGDQTVKKYGLEEVYLSDMILIFPCEPADTLGTYCSSYVYGGQHSGCAYHLAILPNTRPATKEESERMIEHYTQVYGNDVQYKIYSRWQQWFDVEHMKRLEGIK